MQDDKITRRENVLRTYLENPDSTFAAVGKMVNVSRATVRNIVNRYFNEYRIQDKARSGRPTGPSSKSLEKKIVTAYKKNCSLSVRDVAKKLKTSTSMVQRAKVRQNLKSYKKVKAPKQSIKQFNSSVTRSRKLYKLLCDLNGACVLMDDETYVKKDFSTLPGDQFFTTESRANISDQNKYIFMEKFGEKYLIWQAICSCGKRTGSFITKGTINADIYVQKCIKGFILPFIRQHEGDVLFWPDLATAHYARATQECLASNNVQCVAKDMNPPNCPQLRPIERYWALVKAELRKNCSPATSEADFKNKWKKHANKVTETTVQNLMAGLKRKIRLFSRKTLKI